MNNKNAINTKANMNSKRLYLTSDGQENTNRSNASFSLSDAGLDCEANQTMSIRLVEAVVSSDISLFAPNGSKAVLSIASTEVPTSASTFAFLYITESVTSLPVYDVVPKDLEFSLALSQLGSIESVVDVLNLMLDARTDTGNAATRLYIEPLTGILSKEGPDDIIIENRFGWDQSYTGQPDSAFSKTAQDLYAGLGISTTGEFVQYTRWATNGPTNVPSTPIYTPRLPLLCSISCGTRSASSSGHDGHTIASIPIDGVAGLLNERTEYVVDDAHNLVIRLRNSNIVYTSTNPTAVEISEQHLSELSVSLLSPHGEPLFCPYGIIYEFEVQWHASEK